MRNQRLVAVLVTMLLCSALFPLSAQETEAQPEGPSTYSLGDQTLSINVGFFVPLFFLGFQPAAAYPTNLTLGGLGSLQWQAYLNSTWRLGLELGGVFTFSPNLNALLMLPITAKIAYVFNLYPFELPVYLGAGMNIIRYQDRGWIDPILKPGASLYWIYNSSWSFGVNLVYWWDMQFATDPTQTRVGNFLEISLSALYHF